MERRGVGCGGSVGRERGEEVGGKRGRKGGEGKGDSGGIVRREGVRRS